MSSIDDLINVMKALRDPNHGCPWDIKQTSASIASYTLEETHEALDAIERDDMDNLKEELGDLLFHIIFHARIAEENHLFDFNDVAEGIVNKMKRRHPHVFEADRSNQISDEALSLQWQSLKNEEKSVSPDSAFGASSASLSAINRAKVLQGEAAEFGFDWPHIANVVDKLEEEMDELKLAIESGNSDAISDELGDLLFVCMNIARHAKVDAEMALRRTNRKFINRFNYVSEQMKSAGIEMDSQQLDRMEYFWQQSKPIVG
ncbi:nucleoside triphosphate pyrophosphohydrolase [bacterium MnTg03]|nr:nucleoside triphosphate pyrophosphohydrolase [bacterium MnTg03]